MHAITILHRILSASLPEIHAKRLASLLAVVGAVVSGSRLQFGSIDRMPGEFLMQQTPYDANPLSAGAFCQPSHVAQALFVAVQLRLPLPEARSFRHQAPATILAVANLNKRLRCKRKLRAHTSE